MSIIAAASSSRLNISWQGDSGTLLAVAGALDGTTIPRA
jgi:hypothetical protein